MSFPVPPCRRHLIEVHDQPWCPGVLRDALTEWLRVLWEYSQAATVIAPLLARTLSSSDTFRIVDLCSGAGGPIVPVQRQLALLGLSVPAVITDKYPAPALADQLSESSGNLTVMPQPVDARELPESLTGCRTLFNAFHHFTPPEAKRILEDAYRKGQPIAIFEITERTLLKVLLCFPASFLSVFLLLKRMRPRLWIWWLLTWILPVIPLLVAWDGLVSHLRTYSPAEIRRLIDGLSSGSYRWETGRVAAPRGGVEITYLIGHPVRRAAAAFR